MSLVRTGALALAIAVVAAPARADEACKDKDKATELANTGFDLFNKSLYEEASELFRRADEACHNPAFVLFRARAREKLGKLAEAHRLAKRVVDEKLPPGAPEPFLKAKKEAQELYTQLGPRLPSLTVKTPPGTATVALDGAALAAAPSALPVDPGDHEIVASRGDGKEARNRFAIREGQSLTITLDYETGGATSTSGGDGDKGPKPLWIGAGVALGVGGAVLLGGAIAGGVFIGKANALKDKCASDADGDPNNCSPDLKPDGDSVKALGNAATALIVVGAVGAAAGITLAVLASRGPSNETAALRVGPGGMALVGQF